MSEAQTPASTTRGPRTALRVVLAAIVFVALGSAAFVVWGSAPLGPEPPALDAVRSDADVQVAQTPEGWVFTPTHTSVAPTTGLVFYPGGRVDVRS